MTVVIVQEIPLLARQLLYSPSVVMALNIPRTITWLVSVVCIHSLYLSKALLKTCF